MGSLAPTVVRQVESCLGGRRASRVGGGEVLGFGGVGGEIVEFAAAVFKVFEEFPVAGADGADGRGGFVVVRIVPVERVAGELGGWIAENGREIEAVGWLLVGWAIGRQRRGA